MISMISQAWRVLGRLKGSKFGLVFAASKILFEKFARPKDLDAQCRGVVVFLSYSKALDLWLGSVGAGCRALHLSAPRGMCGASVVG